MNAPIRLYMTMSLDGFIAGPDDRTGQELGQDGFRLFNWLDDRMSDGPSGQVFREAMATGAVISGRRTFELAGRWQGDHHDGVPIFVLTHHIDDGDVPPGSARFVTDVAPFSLTGMNVRVIWRRDRYLRGSDHLSFQQQGYPAARLTEPRENFNHEHQDVRVENGVQFGDLPQFVDFGYTARVAKVNGAALWALATNPSTPKNLQIHTAPPPGLPGTNLTALNWDANPEAEPAGYEVVMRETTAADWTSAIGVGNVTSVTLNISKDNVQFGLRAIDKAGHRSPAAFPQVVN